MKKESTVFVIQKDYKMSGPNEQPERWSWLDQGAGEIDQ